MADVQNSGKASPLSLMEESIRAQVKDRSERMSDSEREKEKHLKIYAQIALQSEKIKAVFEHLKSLGMMEESVETSMRIPVMNIQSLLDRTGISLSYAPAGPVTREILGRFDVITTIPREGITVPMVDTTIEPAVYHNSVLLTRGAIQILQPGEPVQKNDNQQDGGNDENK